ncbi:MAG: hypothetical protein FWG64_00050 [Firmicutes bacterium]|nr:hypothetical protein [Bacillota bacterium]
MEEFFDLHANNSDYPPQKTTAVTAVCACLCFSIWIYVDLTEMFMLI